MADGLAAFARWQSGDYALLLTDLQMPELDGLGAKIILGNAYHLMLRPGAETVAAFGGIHGFSSWGGAVLTDSGGFQVFSLAKIRKTMEVGVLFQFDLDGKQEILSPEKSVQR